MPSSYPVITQQKDKPVIADFFMNFKVLNGDSKSNKTDTGTVSISTMVSTLSSSIRKGTSLGISGIMKAYEMRDKFSGSFGEYLSGALGIYAIMCMVFHLSDIEKAEALAVMLKKESISFYMSFYGEGQSYEDIWQMLIDNYMSVEQCNHALIE